MTTSKYTKTTINTNNSSGLSKFKEGLYQIHQKFYAFYHVTNGLIQKYFTSSIFAAMSSLQIAIRYVKYKLKAQTRFDVHSPFLFDFINSIIKDERNFYSFQDIEQLREVLLNLDTNLVVEDYGAGSKKGNLPSRKVSEIAKNALITPKFGRLLFRIVEHYACKNILELGTSLGISTMYLASAGSGSNIITLEGSPEIADFAAKNFEKMGFNNIVIKTGEFSKTLNNALTELGKIDLAFIDGNHRFTPTVEYYEQILSFCHENSILIFDDIHWSSDMEDAWKEIANRKEVSLSIDLFFKGIIFFSKKFHEKSHVTLNF